MKNVYPVLFTKTNGAVLVEVPDFNIMTEGTDLPDAISMARDAISLAGISKEDHAESIPEPSAISCIDVTGGVFAADGETVVSLVDVDFSEYRRKIDTKTVRRNVTLPSWLNYEAEKARINVSRILQDALMEILNVSRD